MMANARLAPRGRCGPAKNSKWSTFCTICPRETQEVKRHDSMKCVGRSLPGARVVRARIFVVDKGGASVSADRPGSRR